jgi:hypothetical protein
MMSVNSNCSNFCSRLYLLVFLLLYFFFFYTSSSSSPYSPVSLSPYLSFPLPFPLPFSLFFLYPFSFPTPVPIPSISSPRPFPSPSFFYLSASELGYDSTLSDITYAKAICVLFETDEVDIDKEFKSKLNAKEGISIK